MFTGTVCTGVCLRVLCCVMHMKTEPSVLTPVCLGALVCVQTQGCSKMRQRDQYERSACVSPCVCQQVLMTSRKQKSSMCSRECVIFPLLMHIMQFLVDLWASSIFCMAQPAHMHNVVIWIVLQTLNANT